MRFGVHVPNFGAYGDPKVIAQLAVLAESRGWDGFFIWDHILWDLRSPQPTCDPWIALAAAGARTRRIVLGTMVTAIARRRPWKLAREVVSLDHLTDGRVVLGAGLGVPPDAEFGAFGEEQDARVRAEKLDEGLALFQQLSSGLPVDYAGTHFGVRGVTFLPPPVRGRSLPIWCGGTWPLKRPFRRAARFDGIVPEKAGGRPLTPDEVREAVEFVEGERSSLPGLADRPFDVAIGGYTPLAGRNGSHIDEFADAGATWWIERFREERGPIDLTYERIRHGPPAVRAAA